MEIYKIENDTGNINPFEEKITDIDFNQISMLIQNCPIPKEAYKTIGEFFKTNPIRNYHESNELLAFLLRGLNEPNFESCLHALKCLYNIVCQGNFEFYDNSIDCEIFADEIPTPDLEFEEEEEKAENQNQTNGAPAEELEEEVHNFNHEQINQFQNTEFSNTLIQSFAQLFQNYDDLHVIYYILRIVTHIISKHPTYYWYINSQIPNIMDAFKVSIFNSINTPFFCRFMKLFKGYIKPKISAPASYHAVCEIATALIMDHSDEYECVKETINLCSFFARECQSWITIFKSHFLELKPEKEGDTPPNLYDHLMSLLLNDIDVDLKRLIVDLLTMAYESKDESSHFDIVIPLINFPHLDLQKSVVQCINQFVLNNGLLVENYIDALLHEIAECFQEGPFNIRKQFIRILFFISNDCPGRSNFIGKFLELGLFPLLVEMIPNIDSMTGQNLFRILIRMVKYVDTIGTPEAFETLLSEFEEADGDSIYQSFIDEVDGRFESKGELDDSFNEIMDQIANFKQVLEAQS